MSHDAARAVLAARHPEAEAAFWAGSLSRGEGTATSDLDLVVVYGSIDRAWRDCFAFEGRLCDTFVHDPASLEMFFAKDVDRGRPTMMAMVAEGVGLIDGALANRVVARARDVLMAGPRAWTADEMARSRFGAGDMLDDLLGSRDPAERRAIGVALYGHLFEHHRRAKGAWSAGGKQIVRVLRREEGAFGQRFLMAFEDLFTRDDPAAAVDLVAAIYGPSGGVLREWRQEAPHRT
ncbi:MAG: nucleotidyltransferase domain-containing protein [Pseudomonadota bacterium]